MNERKHIIPRHDVLNSDALVDHLKQIGKAIIEDAEHLTVDTQNLCKVRVEAEIAPCERVSTVTYTLERIADPRRSIKDADTGEEAQDG